MASTTNQSAELGTFNLSMDYIPTLTGGAPIAAEEQVNILTNAGYNGLVFFGGADQVTRFAAVPQVRDGKFKIVAAYFPIHLYQPTDTAAIEATCQALQAAGSTDMWITFLNEIGPKNLRARLGEIADIAKPHGVNLILYPHYGTVLLTAEDAVLWVKELGRDNVKVAFNLAHELKDGNGDRLPEIIAKVAPHLGAVTIVGADKQVRGEEIQGDGFGYERSIQILGEGDLDVYQTVYLPLKRAGYTGPVVLHDYVMLDGPYPFQRSIDVWKQWTDAAGH